MHPRKKSQDLETYEDKRRKAYKDIASFSISELQRLGELGVSDSCSTSIVEYFAYAVSEAVSNIRGKYGKAGRLLTEKYTAEKKFCNNDEDIALVKDFLDSIKNLELLIKPLNGTGKEEDKDSIFYGEFTPTFEILSAIDKLYDKARNYVTQKP